MGRRLALVTVALTATVLGGYAGRAAEPPVSESGTRSPARDRGVRGRVVEWISSGRRDAYSCSLLGGARKAAEALGVKLLVRDTPGMTWAEQQRLLAERIDGEQGEWPHAVVLDPADYRPPLIMTARSAHDRGLPVVLVDEPQYAEFTPGGATFNPGFVWSFVSSDENAVGGRAVTELARLLGEKPGEMLVVTSAASHPDRSSGFQSGIRANPGFREPHQLTIAGKSLDDDEAAVRSFLRAHPRVAGAFAADAAAAVALARAKATHARPLPVVAGDAEPEELQLLRSGVLQALIVRPGFQIGEVALRVAAEAVIYQKPPQHEIPPPMVLTEEGFEGLAPGSMPAGFDFVRDCSRS